VSEAAGDADTPNHAWRLNNLGQLAFETERHDDAVASYGQALAILDRTLGASHRSTQSTRLALLMARAETGSSPALRAELDMFLTALGPAPNRIDALLLAARLAAESADEPAAQSARAEAVGLVANQAPDSPEAPNRHWLHARALAAMAKRDAAREAFIEAATGYAVSGRAQHPGRSRALLQAALLHPAGSPERTTLGGEARDILIRQLAPPAPSLVLLERL
jgi:tetratricopeptide (TPR) repeat protein